VGKLVAAFIMFLAASALAVHEAKPPPPPRQEPAVVASRVETPDVDRAPTPPPPPRRVITIEPPTIALVDPQSGDYLDVVDRCPDEPTAGARDDEDGCPEPEPIRTRTRDEIILYE
jgi:hypothetical protein